MKGVLKSAACLSIKEAGEMSDEGRKQIAEWLRKQAKGLLTEGKNYAKNFRANYWLNEEKK